MSNWAIPSVGEGHTLHAVLEHRRQASGATAPPPAVVNTLQPGDPHESFDAAVTNLDPPTEHQFGIDTTNTTGAPPELMQVPYLVHQLRIAAIPHRRKS